MTPAITAKEAQSLALLAAGWPDEAAARRAGTSARTMRRRLASAEAKLGARSRPNAVYLAIAAGLIAVPAPGARQDRRRCP